MVLSLAGLEDVGRDRHAGVEADQVGEPASAGLQRGD